MSPVEKQVAMFDAADPPSSDRVYDKKAGRRFVAWTFLPPLILVIARETIGARTVLPTQVPAAANLASVAVGLCLG